MINTLRRFGFVAGFVGVAINLGCGSGTECGAGTHEDGGQCLPDSPYPQGTDYTCQRACEKRLSICGFNEFNGDLSTCVETCLGQSVTDRNLLCYRDATCVEISAGECTPGSNLPVTGDPVCIGDSIYCGYLDSGSTECNSQLGCYWTGSSCEGSKTPCADFTVAASCNSQRGCQWEQPAGGGICIGDSIYCGYLDSGLAECNGQLGCFWTGSSCEGSKTPCADFTSSESCNGQQGCSWQAS